MRNSHHALTDKQLRWIDEYLIDFNGAAASVRAGYSPKSARSIAHENLTKPDILAVLQARQAELAKELKITRQGVIQGLLEAVSMGREQQNPGAMVCALREVSKILGLNVPEVKRRDLTVEQVGLQSNFASMNDAQLLALMEQDAAAAQSILSALLG